MQTSLEAELLCFTRVAAGSYYVATRCAVRGHNACQLANHVDAHLLRLPVFSLNVVPLVPALRHQVDAAIRAVATAGLHVEAKLPPWRFSQ